MNADVATLEALYAAGHWLSGQDRHREALSLYRTMLLVDGRDERGWLGLATCHEQLDEPEKAIALCRLAATACDGEALRCTVARARLHASLGEREEASEAYDDAARLAARLDDDEIAELVAREAGAS